MFSSIIVAASLLAANFVSAAPLEPRSGLTCTASGTYGALKVKHTHGVLEDPPRDEFTTFQSDDQGNKYLAYANANSSHINVSFEVCSGGVEGFQTGDDFGHLKISGTDQCLAIQDYSKPFSVLLPTECATASGEALEKQWFKVSQQGNDTVAELFGNSTDDPKTFIVTDDKYLAASRSPYSIEYLKLVIE